jgi:hypothetical protein
MGDEVIDWASMSNECLVHYITACCNFTASEPGLSAEISKRLNAASQRQPQGAQVEPRAWISTVKCVGPHYGKELYGKLPIQSLQEGYYEHTPLYTQPADLAQEKAKVRALRNRLISERTDFYVRSNELNQYEHARALAEADISDFESAFDDAISGMKSP